MSNESHLPSASCIVVDNDRLQRIECQLGEIRSALVGNSAMGIKGLVHRTEHIESTVEQIQRERRDEASARRGALYVIALAGSVAGAVGGFVVRLFTQPA
jgi:hypothetical protein